MDARWGFALLQGRLPACSVVEKITELAEVNRRTMAFRHHHNADHKQKNSPIFTNRPK